MKKLVVSIAMITLFVSCDNTEVTFDDFLYQTVYFPVQNPVRTIVLGDEIRSDNSIDLAKAFTIGANVGGAYENSETRTLSIRLAPELIPNGPSPQYLITNTAIPDTLALLPANYYKASSLSEIIIPAGSFTGRIRIDLTDDFFNDPKSVNLKYVLPLIITATNKDSILQGEKVVLNPIRTNVADWTPGKRPKDYTLFAVNYTNKYHGAHFHYGLDSLFKANVFTSRKVYSTKPDIEKNTVTTVKTVSLSEATVDRLGGTNVGGKFQMKLKFNTDKSISISSVKGGVPVLGTGTFIEAKDGVVWGGAPHKTLYLKYTFTDDAGFVHKSKDTLVYRSSGVVYREFTLK